MVDNMNPTTQFHPYQRETSVPVAERTETGLNGFLNFYYPEDILRVSMFFV